MSNLKLLEDENNSLKRDRKFFVGIIIALFLVIISLTAYNTMHLGKVETVESQETYIEPMPAPPPPPIIDDRYHGIV